MTVVVGNFGKPSRYPYLAPLPSWQALLRVSPIILQNDSVRRSIMQAWGDDKSVDQAFEECLAENGDRWTPSKSLIQRFFADLDAARARADELRK